MATLEELLKSKQMHDPVFSFLVSFTLDECSDEELVELLRQTFTVIAARLTGSTHGSFELHSHGMRLALKYYMESLEAGIKDANE